MYTHYICEQPMGGSGMVSVKKYMLVKREPRLGWDLGEQLRVLLLRK